jgi:hypothetical protein
MPKDKARSSSIILDLSIKSALERRAGISPRQEVILPWWFRREVSHKYSQEVMEAMHFLMDWLNENAPDAVEHIYCEANDTQNIIINPVTIIEPRILEAFGDAGFKIMTEDDMPASETTDIKERLLAGSNFSDKWH